MMNQSRPSMGLVVVLALVAGALAGACGGAAVGLGLAGAEPTPAAAPAPPVEPAPGATALTVQGGDSAAIKAAIAQADPAVVNVTTLDTTVIGSWGELLEVPGGQGTGFVFDAERGLILTNEHVVGGRSDPIVTMLQPDGSTVELNARVLSSSPADDIALLQVEAYNLPSVGFGDPAALEVGDWIVAIGSPFGLDHTATVGVVSALGRRFRVPDGPGLDRIYDDMIQTDAAINSGNSGGPLIDLAGNVVGMNTLITSPSGASAGVGFAISATKLRVIVQSMLSEGVVGFVTGIANPQWLAESGAPRGRYMQVREVVDGGPADAGGLQPGDLILSINDEQVHEPFDLRKALSGMEPGDELAVTVFRNDSRSEGDTVTVPMTVVRQGDLWKGDDEDD